MPDPDVMDVAGVLDLLNTSLALQYRSALQYLLVAGGSQGTHGLAVGEQLWAYAEAEFSDARALVSKIVALGGQPTARVEPLLHVAAIGDALDHLVKVEGECIAALHAVIPATGQEPGSEALEHLMEHLIMRKQNQVDFLIRARA